MMNGPNLDPKKPRPDWLEPSTARVTGDYFNQFVHFPALVLLQQMDITEIRQHIVNNPVQTYAETYKQYDNIIDDRNRDRVAALDQCVERINTKANAGTLTSEELLTIVSHAENLIYGHLDP